MPDVCRLLYSKFGTVSTSSKTKIPNWPGVANGGIAIVLISMVIQDIYQVSLAQKLATKHKWPDRLDFR